MRIAARKKRRRAALPIELSLAPMSRDDGPFVAITIRSIGGRLGLEAPFEKLYRDAKRANREMVHFTSRG